MENLILFLVISSVLSCTTREDKSAQETSDQRTKIPVYAWLGGPGESTDEELKSQFEDFKMKGIDVLMYNGGQEPEVYERVGKIKGLL